MCTEFIQIIDSSIPKYHTSNLLTQTSQHHLKSYIAAAVGRQNKSMVNYNDNCNIKSSHTTGSKSLKPTNPSSTPESESIIHAKKESKDSASPNVSTPSKPIFTHTLPKDFFSSSSPPAPLPPIKFLGSNLNSPIASPHIHPTAQPTCPEEPLSIVEQSNTAEPGVESDILPPSSYQQPNQYNLGKPNPTVRRLSLGDFEIKQTLGTGSSARVHLARSKTNRKYYAIKAINKKDLMSRRQIEHAHNEREVLGSVSHPFLVKLWGTFQSETHVFLVMDYVPGGELFRLIRRNKRLTEEAAKFYAAEVTLAVDYLHNMNVIYRDLKPENILLDLHGHIKITDFGFAKKIEDRTWTVCGTPDYLAPEIIRAQGYTKAVDWWSLGVLIYEMIVGRPPFTAKNPIDQYQRILECDIQWPEDMSPEAKDLIQNLLQTKPSERFGTHGADDIKSHPWFKGVDFEQLLARQVDPPYTPDLKFEGDTRCFAYYEEMHIPYNMIQTNQPYCDHFAYF